jgi:hypothetical protein
MNHSNTNSFFCLNEAHAGAVAEGPGNAHQINSEGDIYLPDDPAADAMGAFALAIEVEAETEAYKFTRRMVARAERTRGKLEPILCAARYLAEKAAAEADRLCDVPRHGAMAWLRAVAADAAATAVHANYLARLEAPAPGEPADAFAPAPGEQAMTGAVLLLNVLEAEAAADTQTYEQTFTTHYTQAARSHYGLDANVVVGW